MYKIDAFDSCVRELAKLPGVGRKTAARLAMHILKGSSENAAKLAESVCRLKERVVFCKFCGAMTEAEVCGICLDDTRERDTICVVEDARDLFVIESTGQYYGLYHVLGGKISPLEGVGPEDIRIDELLSRVVDLGICEVILATNPDVDGETTAIYITKKLKSMGEFLITKIASGVPVGSHLEYVDDLTVLRALEGRRNIGD